MHPRSLLQALSLIALVTAAAACGKQKEGPASASGSASAALPAEPVAPATAGAHGDHAGRHGGYVLMDERGHAELVFGAGGDVSVWFSDPQHTPIAASKESKVELTLTAPGKAAEVVALAKDPADAAWSGKAAPITDSQTRIHFAYEAPDKAAPYAIDVTLGELQKMQGAAEADHDHDHDHGDQDHGDQHHGDHDDGHGATSAAPTSLAAAAAQLAAAHEQLAAIVKDGDLSKAHEAADRMRTLAAALPELAAKAGVPADDVKELTVAAKKIGLFFGDIDEAGDAGKRDVAQAVFARYAQPMKAIRERVAHHK